MKLYFLFSFVFSLLINFHAWSLDVQEISTKKGITFWFVEDHSVPLLSMSISFKGGAYFDEIGKEGTSSFVASLLDEGSGELDSINFQERMKSLGMKLRFSSSKDNFSGTFQTVSENITESFNLLKLAINHPAFNKNAIEKIRNQVNASLKIQESDIQYLASKNFDESFYNNHKFSRSDTGTIESIKKIKKEDLKKYVKKYFTKSNLVIGVSGDITKDKLIKLIDSTFGNLDDGKNISFLIPKFNSLNKGKKVVTKETPQTSVVFGQRGLKREDEDFFAARIANYVLGGGGFQSKLYKKIREENGLVYSIYSYLIPFTNDGIIIGGFQTKNSSVYETIDLLKDEWDAAKKKGLTQEELDNAKSYFIGSFSRNYTSTLAIANLLETIQFYNLGIDYFQRREKIIKNLTLENINEVSKNIFNTKKLFFSIVGKPE